MSTILVTLENTMSIQKAVMVSLTWHIQLQESFFLPLLNFPHYPLSTGVAATSK